MGGVFLVEIRNALIHIFLHNKHWVAIVMRKYRTCLNCYLCSYSYIPVCVQKEEHWFGGSWGKGGGNNPGPGQLEVKLISQKNEEWIRSDPIRRLCFMSDQCICMEKYRLSFSPPPISLIFNSDVCVSFLLIMFCFLCLFCCFTLL